MGGIKWHHFDDFGNIYCFYVTFIKYLILFLLVETCGWILTSSIELFNEETLALGANLWSIETKVIIHMPFSSIIPCRWKIILHSSRLCVCNSINWAVEFHSKISISRIRKFYRTKLTSIFPGPSLANFFCLGKIWMN